MSIEILRKEFQGMLVIEQRAKNFYEHYIDQIDDRAIKKQLIAIRDDEVIHIKIAHALIKCVT
ncbi:MAG: hypothetical protein ACE5JK_04435 [Candidatus Omnitrophota bacterium]